MNSSLFFYMIELNSRNYGGGGGPIDVTVNELSNFIIADINKLRKESIQKLKTISSTFTKRKILSIYDELGFNRTEPIREQQPNPLQDRKELDDIIFNEIGLTQDERNEVYWSVAELVKQRLDKAASR